MPQHTKCLVVVAAALAGAFLLSTPAAAISLEELSWQTIAIDDVGGATVQFEARFVNNNEVASEPVTGDLNPQPFGAFVGNAKGFICSFDVPSLQPLEEFTVFCQISLAALPPSAERLLPWEGDSSCPPDDFWAGGVEASWTGDGDGLRFVHRGTLQVCPILGNSYIRVVIDCPGGAAWQFVQDEGCFGYVTDLVNEDFTEAPNPLPPGQFNGWIAVDGDIELPPGDTCSYDLLLTCGDKTAQIHMVSEACDCTRSTAVEPSTWGAIKQRLSR